MEMLLTKFRIKFHELIILSNLKTKASASTLAEFDRLLENWRLKPNESLEDFPHKITDAIYEENLHKVIALNGPIDSIDVFIFRSTTIPGFGKFSMNILKNPLLFLCKLIYLHFIE